MASANRDHIWNGNPLGQGPIALVALVEQAPDVTGTMEPVVGAATAEEYVELVQEQIAAFLQAHADRVLSCHDAAKVHWSLHECLKSAQAPHNALQTLWSFSRESRLHDIMLLDQRCRLVLEGLHSLPRPLGQLAREYCDIRLGDAPDVQGRLSAILAIYSIVRQRIDEFITQLEPLPQSVPPPHAGSVEIEFDEQGAIVLKGGPTDKDLDFDPIQVLEFGWKKRRREELLKNVSRFGPLGLGIDVQGVIALYQAFRNGMEVDPEAARDIRRECDGLYRRCSGMLNDNRHARQCFRWDENLVRRDRKGYTKTRNGPLRAWLGQLLNECHDLRNAPLKPPLDRTGRLSTVPRHWGVLTRCHPLLRAWAGLESAAAADRFLDQVDKARPLYGVIPRLHSSNPDLTQLRKFRQRLFVPKPDHVFLVGKLRDLELRCHGVVCEHWAGQPSRVAQAFRDGQDPVQETTNRLCDKLAEAQSKRDHRSSFLQLDHEKRLASIRLLMFAVPRGLSVPQMVELLQTELGVCDLGRAEVDHLLRLLVLDVRWEWEFFLEDPTPRVVAEKLDIPFSEFSSELFPTEHPHTWPFTLRRVLAGKIKGEMVWQKLRSLAKNGPYGDQIAQMAGGPETYDFFMTTNPVSITGRVGRPLYWTERKTAEYLQLADEVMKTVIYELVAAGFRLVAVAGDAFVLEVLDSEQAASSQVASIANATARKLLGGVARNVCFCQNSYQW